MALDTLHDLFVHELRDLYDAEQQIVTGLPLMVQAAKAPPLQKLFNDHLRETSDQIDRLDQLFGALGVSFSGRSCKAMQGLLSEARETIQEEADPEVLDAALIVAAQKIEHYEIAGYGSVRAFAEQLGYTDAERLLAKTLEEETTADKKLTQLAERRLNRKASSDDIKAA
jgi:ferritin-like metal-binding protein YciE